MARIAGIELRDNNRLIYELTRVKGVGWSRSRKVFKELGFPESIRVFDLQPEEVAKITTKLEESPIEGELSRRVRENIRRLKNISSYRGRRHTLGLPVRGQRTRSNARTKRGKRRTVGAFRKSMLAKMQPKDKKEETK